MGSSLTSVIALCPRAGHINPSLVLVQPRKTYSYIAEILLIGHKESNQMQINVKMSTIVGILTFMSLINFMLS